MVKLHQFIQGPVQWAHWGVEVVVQADWANGQKGGAESLRGPVELGLSHGWQSIYEWEKQMLFGWPFFEMMQTLIIFTFSR